MLNETITFLSGVDIHFLAAFFGIIGGVITIFMFFLGILPYIKSKKDFSDLFIYRKAKKLQQNDFAIQQPLNANAEVYKRRGSDEEIEKSLRNHENVLVIGMPKSGKTRSIYQAIKSVFPEFYAIKPPAEKIPRFCLPWFRKDYLIFFDDLNKFAAVDFDFSRFLDEFKYKSKKLVVIATCRSGDEFEAVRTKSMDVLRTFQKVVELDEYKLSEEEGRELAKKAGVKWKPEQFLGTPGSVILDIEDMRNRYKNLNDIEKTILRTCKLLRSANIFTYEKELIKTVCDSIFGININESVWIDSINYLEGNSLVTKPEKSSHRINVYDPQLESIINDYSSDDHLGPLLNLFIELKDAYHLFYLGNAFHEGKNDKNTEKCYRMSLKFNPNLAEVHNNLGNLLYNLERFGEAEKEYREAIKKDPNYAKVHSNLGALLKKLGQPNEAEMELKEAIRSNPNLAEVHYNLGVLLEDLERYDEAEEEYKKAIKLNLNLAEAHANLGILFLIIERSEEAKKELKIAKELFEKEGREEDVKKAEELLKSL